jgi:purine-nucleoside/S-methyl-5'-thioadenosine phosphorylase / adenosine deaminase
MVAPPRHSEVGASCSEASASRLRIDLPGGGALFTTRSHGNLSTLRGEDAEHGRREREALCAELGLRWLCASRQVHGTTVLRVRAEDGSGGEALALDADGHATALRGVGVMVLVADCLPVLLASRDAVAAVHAGWRGLAEGVLEEGVRAVRELSRAPARAPGDGVRQDRGGGPDRGGAGLDRGGAGWDGGDDERIVAFVGPGAGPCCYEVGEEVHAAFGGAGRVGARNIDLPALAQERLTAAGVERVERTGLCTICDAGMYSHRREGAQAGRQAGVVWLS